MSATLKRSIGPMALMFTAIGGMVGTGWLFSPLYAASHAGPSALVGWLVGMLATLLIAMTFAEITCLFPVAGGNARFIFFSHGVLTSFLFNFITWLTFAAVAPIETMGVVQYLSSIFPALVKPVDGVAVLSPLGFGVAAGILFLMCIINLLNVKLLSYYNTGVVWLKIIIPIAVAIVISLVFFHLPNFTAFGGFMPFGVKGVTTALSLGGVIFSFAGFAPAIVLAGEAKNPQKVIPFVLFGALFICFVLYALLQAAFIGAQNPLDLVNGWNHLPFAESASPFVMIAQNLHLTLLHYLILVIAIVAPLGTAIIFVATAARVAYAMSENKSFPQIFTKLNGNGVPYVSILVNFAIGLLLFVPSPGWENMVAFIAAGFVLGYIVGPICTLCFRTQFKDKERKFKLPFVKAWCFISLFVANLILYWTGWHTVSQMMMIIIVGLIVFLGVYFCQKQRSSLDVRNALWMIFYLLGMSAISYFGNQGGGIDFIKPGIDVVVIGFYSLIILILAWYGRLPETKVAAYLQSELQENLIN